MDGIFGMALSPYQQGRDRYLYFHALAATTENILNTKVIRNDSLLQDPNIDPDAVYVRHIFTLTSEIENGTINP